MGPKFSFGLKLEGQSGPSRERLSFTDQYVSAFSAFQNIISGCSLQKVITRTRGGVGNRVWGGVHLEHVPSGPAHLGMMR